MAISRFRCPRANRPRISCSLIHLHAEELLGGPPQYGQAQGRQRRLHSRATPGRSSTTMIWLHYPDPGSPEDGFRRPVRPSPFLPGQGSPSCPATGRRLFLPGHRLPRSSGGSRLVADMMRFKLHGSCSGNNGRNPHHSISLSYLRVILPNEGRFPCFQSPEYTSGGRQDFIPLSPGLKPLVLQEDVAVPARLKAQRHNLHGTAKDLKHLQRLSREQGPFDPQPPPGDRVHPGRGALAGAPEAAGREPRQRPAGPPAPRKKVLDPPAPVP